MKKIVIVLIMLLILISCFTAQVEARCCCCCRKYVPPTASKQISAIRLTLVDGTVLHNVRLSQIKKANVTTTQNYKTLNLNILVDTSENIQLYINTVKEKLQELVNSIYGFYGNNQEKAHINVIYFNGDINFGEGNEHYETKQKNKAEVITEINNISINNTNRDIISAIDIANSTYKSDEDENYSSLENIQQLILITDDITTINEDAKKTINGKLDSMTNVAVSVIELEVITEELGEDYILSEIDIAESNNFFKASIDELIKELNDNIKTIEEIKLEGLKDNVFATDKEVCLLVDDEILNGATLEIEYIIKYNRGSEMIPSVYIQDTIDPNLNFRKDAKLLTENATNAGKGWKATNEKLVTNDLPVWYLQEVTTKIVLSTTLTVENIPDKGYVNKALVGGIPTQSMITKIIPPFGENNATADLIRIIALVVAIILVLVLYKIYRRKR